MAEIKKSAMFVWEGNDASGKRVKGEVSGQSEALVRAVLRRQKINPTKVKKKPKPLSLLQILGVFLLLVV